MVIDRRKKGCPNKECESHKKKVKYDTDFDYCPKCSSKLVYVCVKCYKEIEDRGPGHRICDLCIAKEEERKEEIVGKIKGAVGKVAAGVGVAGAGIVAGIVNDSKQEIIKQGGEAGKVAIKNGGKVLGTVIKAVIH